MISRARLLIHGIIRTFFFHRKLLSSLPMPHFPYMKYSLSFEIRELWNKNEQTIEPNLNPKQQTKFQRCILLNGKNKPMSCESVKWKIMHVAELVARHFGKWYLVLMLRNFLFDISPLLSLSLSISEKRKNFEDHHRVCEMGYHALDTALHVDT